MTLVSLAPEWRLELSPFRPYRAISSQVLRRLADGAMEPIPLSSLSFRPSPGGGLNPLLLPIQLPYLMVERIITRVESVLKLTEDDKVR